jgi:hypothetical protein
MTKIKSEEEGEIRAGLVFSGCFRCGVVGHRATNCPTYKDLIRAKCSKYMEKNVSLCHRPEECQGHTAEFIREQVEQDAARPSERRGAGTFRPTRGPFPAKNGREAKCPAPTFPSNKLEDHLKSWKRMG